MSDLRRRVEAAFAAVFGGAPDLIVRAPGRVNLIGEHTDYNDGFVLPAAIGVHSLIAARARGDRQLRIVAADFGNATTSFDLDAPITLSSVQPWSNYVRGVISAMQADGMELPGAELVLAGTIPQGSGLSSSASVAVGVATAFNALAGLALDPTAIALLAQRAECEFVGMNCGIMDQLASARGQAGHALLIDCRTLDCRPIKLPEDLAIVIVHSGITRGLVEGAYNERRAQCEQAAAQLGLGALRDATPALLEQARGLLPPLAYLRARHVITENERTLAAAEALERGDLAKLGRLMASSHASMRDDFQITLPAIDALVALLQGSIGEAGGARMTGGGFGGAVVALMPKTHVDRVISAVRCGYVTPDGSEPLILIESASPGAAIA